jgi:hypothetical protein
MTRTIRASSLVTSQDCGRRWAASHLTDEIVAAGYDLTPRHQLHIGAAVGSGVHAGVSWTLETKRDTGDLGAESEAIDRAVAEFEARATEEGLSFDETTRSVGTAQQQIARMTRSYRRHVAPVVAPRLVETRLVADIGGGWLLSGQGDVLAGDPTSDVRDLKTGNQKRANGAQYGAYAMIFEAHGFHATGIVEDFVPRVRLDKEQPAPTSTQIDVAVARAEAVAAMQDIQRSVADFERRLGAGEPMPETAFRANPASQLCSARFCRAWGTRFCRAHLS